jgi:DNA-binding LytR/AlgR family response regulator
VHKSYLVNLAAVAEIRSGAVTLANGMTVPIGKRYRSETLGILRS